MVYDSSAGVFVGTIHNTIIYTSLGTVTSIKEPIQEYLTYLIKLSEMRLLNTLKNLRSSQLMRETKRIGNSEAIRAMNMKPSPKFLALISRRVLPIKIHSCTI